MRVRWNSIYPNPAEVSRMKYYEYKIENDVAYVYGDGLVIDYTIEQLKEFFIPEIGNWEDFFKASKKEIDKIIK